MLRSLTIENFAIIESVAIDFNQGMTVLSGETGAGKSIIIDALSLLMGGRGSTEFIRTDSPKLVVEGLFDVGEEWETIQASVNNFGMDIDLKSDDLILRREINQQGKNTIRINGQLANVSLLREIGNHLADIHGQNEHQSLLNPKQHLQLLDQFAGDKLKNKLNDYQQAYAEYASVRKAWLQAQKQDNQQQQRLSFLQFQWEELDKAQLVAGEEELLEQTSQQIQHQQMIQEQLLTINQLMSEGDITILDQLMQVLDALSKIERFDEHYAEVDQQLTHFKYELEEIAHYFAGELVTKNDAGTEFDELEARLSELSQLKRKYQMDINALMDYRDQIEEEINQIIHRDQYLDQLRSKLLPAYHDALVLAQELHDIRQEASTNISLAVNNELTDLYMKEGVFETRFSPGEVDDQLQASFDSDMKFLALSEQGYDSLEFYVATNRGEGLKPLVKVASGGELSRFMLALKVIFGQAVSDKVMVFDEIDTGVSGRVAFAIAQKMYQLASHQQVLAITHLPQVAAISDHQVYIEKRIIDNRTQTQVRGLSMEERYQAVAMMMSGEQVTDTSLQVVKDMVAQLRK